MLNSIELPSTLSATASAAHSHLHGNPYSGGLSRRQHYHEIMHFSHSKDPMIQELTEFFVFNSTGEPSYC